MKLSIYTLYDIKAKAFGVPFFMSNDEVAERAFLNLQNEPNSQVSKNPEDFHMYKIGEFDDNTGNIFPQDIVKII